MSTHEHKDQPTVAPSAHTPGPWSSELQWAHDVDDKLFVFGRWIAAADGAEICNDVLAPEDARLIAATPDLYEALKQVAADHDRGALTLGMTTGLMVMNAIARAEGREP